MPLIPFTKIKKEQGLKVCKLCLLLRSLVLLHPPIFHGQPPCSDQSENGNSGCVLYCPSAQRQQTQVHSGLLRDVI